MATIIDGKKTSADIRLEIKDKVEEIKEKGGKIPHLAAILVGTDGASEAGWSQVPAYPPAPKSTQRMPANTV